MIRVLRGLFAIKKQLTAQLLRRIVNGYYTHSTEARDKLIAFIPAPANEKEAAESANSGRLRGAKSALTPLLPEVDCYLHLLILVFLLDGNRLDERTVECANELMQKLVAQNRRSLDHIAARCYFYYTRYNQGHCFSFKDFRPFTHYWHRRRCFEKRGEIGGIRGLLHSRLRTATLRNDFEGQAVLINCLLRSYVEHNLFDQADKLVNKTTFPESASNNEWARFLFYLGRIKAIQLEYTEAHKHLVQSLRKAPQKSALGFRHTVLKLSITVELLLGDIPDRRTFLQPQNKKALEPYLRLTQGELSSCAHMCPAAYVTDQVAFSRALRRRQPLLGGAEGERRPVQGRPHLHPDPPAAPQRRQDGHQDHLARLLQDLPGGSGQEAQAGDVRRRRVHRRQGEIRDEAYSGRRTTLAYVLSRPSATA